MDSERQSGEEKFFFIPLILILKALCKEELPGGNGKQRDFWDEPAGEDKAALHGFKSHFISPTPTRGEANRVLL